MSDGSLAVTRTTGRLSWSAWNPSGGEASTGMFNCNFQSNGTVAANGPSYTVPAGFELWITSLRIGGTHHSSVNTAVFWCSIGIAVVTDPAGGALSASSVRLISCNTGCGVANPQATATFIPPDSTTPSEPLVVKAGATVGLAVIGSNAASLGGAFGTVHATGTLVPL